MCYHRIIFMSSSFDLLASFWFFMNSWAQPISPGFFEDKYPGSDYSSLSLSCDMSGFSIYIGSLTIPWYKAALLVYYYLAVCCKWNEKKIMKNFERYVHFLVPISAILAALPLFWRLYRNFYSYCFVVDVTGGNLILSAILQLMSVASAFLSTCIMAVVIVLLFTAERKKKKADRQKSLQALTMSCRYATVFSLTYILPMVWITCAQLSFQTKLSLPTTFSYIMARYLAVFLPLQGFLTWIVYLYPRFRRLRKRESFTCKLISDVLFRSCSSRLYEDEDDGDCYLGSCMEDFEDDDCNFTEEKDITDIENPISSSGSSGKRTLAEVFLGESSDSDSDSVITCGAVITSYEVDGASITASLTEQDSNLSLGSVKCDEDSIMQSCPDRLESTACNSSDESNSDNTDESYDKDLRQACEKLPVDLYPPCTRENSHKYLG